MAKFTASWDESKPAGTRSKLLGDDDIREFKQQFRERFGEDHVSLQNETDDSLVGFHKKTTFPNQASDPLPLTDALILFSKKIGSYSELQVQHENAGLIQLTRLGKLLISSLGIASEARGDLIVRDSSGWNRLALGASGKYIKSDGTDVSWGDVGFQTAATQAEVEAATSNTVPVTPATLQNHPGVAKAYCVFNGTTAGTNAPTAGYNVASVTRNGVGDYTINFTTPFSSVNYALAGFAFKSGEQPYVMGSNNYSKGVGSVRIQVYSVGSAIIDATEVNLVFHGDQ